MSKTTEILSNLAVLAQNGNKENLRFFKNFNKKKMRELDQVTHDAHDEIFSWIDCLECANCCKTLGPRLTEKDIERISKGLKMKQSTFIETWLQVDEDSDYVFKTMPCPFLMADNLCMIYDMRPKACREYPHTDRSKFLQISKLTVKNSETCPAVHLILEKIKQHFTT